MLWLEWVSINRVMALLMLLNIAFILSSAYVFLFFLISALRKHTRTHTDIRDKLQIMLNVGSGQARMTGAEVSCFCPWLCHTKPYKMAPPKATYGKGHELLSLGIYRSNLSW